LFDPRRVQVTWAQGTNMLAGDARLSVVLPADGTYTLELHDAQYKAGAPNRFRLKLGDLHSADLAFPVGAQRGGKRSFQLIGNLKDPAKVEMDLTTTPAGSFLLLPRVPGLSGMMPRILVSEIPEVIETDQPAGKLQEVDVPVGINGRIGALREEDRYR